MLSPRMGLLLCSMALACCARTPGPKSIAPRLSATLTLSTDPSVIDRVEVIGELPGAPLQMEQGERGQWSITVSGLQPQLYRYLFRVHRSDLDGWIEVADPKAWLLDPSRKRWALLQPGFEPKRPPDLPHPRKLQDLMIYELSPRELVSKETKYADTKAEIDAKEPGAVFQSITERIRAGYFNDLGVNAIELLPVFANAWTRSKRPTPERDPWGYDVLSWYALNGDYGTPEDFAELVRAAHEKDLAVLIDFSLAHGHGGGSHGVLTDIQPTWQTNPNNPWGLIELDASNDEVRAFYLGALERLVTVYNVDGFRMDWSDPIKPGVWRSYVEALRRMNPNLVVISENPQKKFITESGFDGTWDFFFHWEAPLMLRRVYKNYDGYAKRMVDTQEKLVENLTQWDYLKTAPRVPLVRYIESHDLPRIARERVKWQMGGDHLLDVDGDQKTPDWLDHGGQETSRLAMTLLATVPGAIMLFAGQEIGATDELIWSYDPLDWSKKDPETFAHYRRMLKLRAANPVLRSDDIRILVNDPERHLLVYSRGSDPKRAEDDTILVVLSFAEKEEEVSFELPAAGCWKDLLTNEPLKEPALVVDLPPNSGRVLGCKMEGEGKGCVPRATCKPTAEAAPETPEVEQDKGLSKGEITSVINRHIAEVQFCVERTILTKPICPALEISWTITKSGSVTDLKTTMLKPQSAKDYERCVLDAVSRWRFPKPRGGSEVTVSYPFLFRCVGF